MDWSANTPSITANRTAHSTYSASHTTINQTSQRDSQLLYLVRNRFLRLHPPQLL